MNKVETIITKRHDGNLKQIFISNNTFMNGHGTNALENLFTFFFIRTSIFQVEANFNFSRFSVSILFLNQTEKLA